MSGRSRRKTFDFFHTGDDARILETLTDPTVAEVWPLDDNWSPTSFLEQVARSGAHALIDAGALITGLNNLGVATELLKLLPETYQAVVYLDGAGKKMVLKRGVDRPLPLASAGVDMAR